MELEHLHRKFLRIGARLKVAPIVLPSWRRLETPARYTLDVATDRRGEFFDLRLGKDPPALTVLDARAKEKHLLLLISDPLSIPEHERTLFDHVLCGHDERHWFVAAAETGSSVRQAMEALKPAPVLDAQDRLHLKAGRRNRRRNAAFVRQGEWFFVPAPELSPPEWAIHRPENLSRGRSRKAHVADEGYRQGGGTVYVCGAYPQGLSEKEYRDLLLREPEARRLGWTTMRANPTVYVRGRVRHPDHKTIVLVVWHRVLPSREVTPAGVVFLD